MAEGSGAASSSSMALHRVHFVDWAPSAVTALAFSPSLQQNGRGILAIGRDNGNIDLCVWTPDDTLGEEKHGEPSSSSSAPHLAQNWVVDTTLVGTSAAKIESLAFVQTPALPYPMPRLFSTSGGASITEHFLPLHILRNGRSSSQGTGPLPSGYQTGTSRTIPSHGGSVWSMAASPLGRAIAIGCDDGHVRIVDIDEGRFELLSSTRSARRGGDGVIRGLASHLDRAKTRIVSLAWGPPRRRETKAKNTKRQVNAATSDSSDDDSDDDYDEKWEDTFIIGGTTHSSALVWDASSGRIEGRLLVDKTRKEQTIVWSTATLGDGTCVLGDSLGHVSFFDGRTRTLLPGGRFASHKKRADVLSLCVGPDGKSVYSASVDQCVCEYLFVAVASKVNNDDHSAQTAKWISTNRRKLHRHDVRAVAIDPPFNPRNTSNASTLLPVLVSGGTDCQIVLTPAKSLGSLLTLPKAATSKKALAKLKEAAIGAADMENPISSTSDTFFSSTIQHGLPFVPLSGKGGALGGGGVVRLCSARRWIVLRRETSIGIWSLPPASATPTEQNEANVTSAEQNEGWKKIIEMQVKASSNLTCAELSPDGRYLFVSDVYESKLFELQTSSPTDIEVVPQRVKSFGRAFSSQGILQGPGASAATFTPDSRRLVLASHPGSFVHVVELAVQYGKVHCSLLKSFDEHRRRSTGPRAVAGRLPNGSARNGAASDDSEDDQHQGMEAAARTLLERIDTVGVSPDGQYLVSIDTAKRIHVFSLDTLHYSAPLPSPSQRPSSLAFDPWRPHRLTLILPTNRLVVYDLEARAADGAALQSRSLTSGHGRLNGINGHVTGEATEADSRLDNGFAEAIESKLRRERAGAIGGVWLSADAFLLWGSTWMCTARRKAKSEAPQTMQQNGKRARDGEGTQKDAAVTAKSGKHSAASQWKTQMSDKYKPLLFVGTTKAQRRNASANDADELVVVERPYHDVARGLPPTYFGGSPFGT